MQNDGPIVTQPNRLSESTASEYPAYSLDTLEDASATAHTQRLIATPDYLPQPAKHTHRLLSLITLGIIGLVLLLGSGLLILQRANRVPISGAKFGIVKVPLTAFTGLDHKNAVSEHTLEVRGQLRVDDSMVLTPTSQPTDPQTGQLFFDKTSNTLGYYNGQEFLSIGSGTSVTNITNVLSGSGNGVQLQSNAPGTQQAGNFNISGVGAVGTLKTTVIDSGGGTLYVSPLGATSQQEIAAGTAAKLGLTNGSLSLGPGWNGELIATKATMGNVGGNATSITVFFSGGSGSSHLQVAIYDDDGDIPSKPGNLLASSAVANLTPNSFNTVTIPTVNLTANATYWLAVNTDDGTVARTYDGGSKASCFISKIFGSMPNPFNAGGCFYDDNIYAIYANYTVGGGASGTFSQALFVLGPTGQAQFRNSTDSTTAFQVQNATDTSTILNVDTLNGRIGIGKTTPSYKLDIAAGDINLSNGRSLRFGGLQALSMNSSGTTTSLANFNAGGTVSIQANNFVVQDPNATHQNMRIDSGGATTFSNLSNSSAGFEIQNAAGASLFRADTSGMQIYIGNHAGDNAPVILYLANKNTAGDPLGEEGGTYYNSTLSSFRCFNNGFWHNCSDIEPQHSFSLYDEFLGGQTSFAGGIGNLGWNAVAIGANGSLSLNPASPTPAADRPGVLRLQTPASTNQGSTLILGDNSGGSLLIAKDNDVKTSIAAGSATDQTIRVGLHTETSGTAQPVSGVWWEADPAADTNWRYCYGDGGTATCTASSVAITANTWVTLEIRITATGNSASSATFVINNVPFTISGATIDTTNRVSPALTCYALTNSVQNCYWDYFQITGTTSAQR